MSEVKVDTISERTAASGVTIDGVLVKDGTATFQTAAGSPLVFEGATADAHETTFAITDPTADRTITFPDASFTVPTSGGVTQVQQWRVDTDFTISTTDLNVYQNWEKPASGQFHGSIGGDMAVDSTTSATLSGAWTFPETGTWLVRWCMFTEGSGGSASLYAHIAVTDDNGANWVTGARNDSYGFHNQDNAVSVEYIVNIADTSTDKVKFHGWSAAYSVIIRGHTDYNAHYATFMRLGDAS